MDIIDGMVTNVKKSEIKITLAPPATQEDWEWIKMLWVEEWGGEIMISRGKSHH